MWNGQEADLNYHHTNPDQKTALSQSDNVMHLILIIDNMFFKKYKYLKNNGLLPKIDHPKSENVLQSYCLIQENKEHQYSLLRNPSARNMLIMFNDKQYLHRKFSHITTEPNSEKILAEISPMFPKGTHTLSIFIVNAPRQCDQILLGRSDQQGKEGQADSLLTMAYKSIIANKSQKSVIRLSIIGIQNENSLTDELNLEWLCQQEPIKQQSTPLQVIIKGKQKVKVMKQVQGTTFFTQNLTHHDIKSEPKLKELIERYRDAKTYLQDWIITTESPQFYLLGQLYHLVEVQPATEEQPEIILQSHYMLRINQYFRMTSSLMLRLGIHLRRASGYHAKSVQMHENKLFKLLSECFLPHTINSKGYRFHLFLQVGKYLTLKDEYLCLVPTSQEMSQSQVSSLNSILQSECFYTKQIMEYPELHGMINRFIPDEKSSSVNSTILPQISGQFKARLKTRSYVCDTYSSHEKRISKHRHFITEQSNDHSQMNLEELVYEAAKIYRLPSPKKDPTIVIKQNLTQMRKAHKNVSLFEKSTQGLEKEKETNFEKRRKDMKLQESKKELPRNKFYQQTKEWLGLIYGKNSSKKLQSAQKRVRKFDETTNLLIRDMLSKEINIEANQDIDEVIDRF